MTGNHLLPRIKPIILVAIDDEQLYENIRCSIDEARYQIQRARNKRVAIKIARILRPALIILDLDSEPCAGLDTLRALKDAGAGDIRAIVLHDKQTELSTRLALACDEQIIGTVEKSGEITPLTLIISKNIPGGL